MLDSKIKLNKAQEHISNKFKYTFINSDLLLEAITHKSISKNNSLPCRNSTFIKKNEGRLEALYQDPHK